MPPIVDSSPTLMIFLSNSKLRDIEAGAPNSFSPVPVIPGFIKLRSFFSKFSISCGAYTTKSGSSSTARLQSFVVFVRPKSNCNPGLCCMAISCNLGLFLIDAGAFKISMGVNLICVSNNIGFLWRKYSSCCSDKSNIEKFI